MLSASHSDSVVEKTEGLLESSGEYCGRFDCADFMLDNVSKDDLDAHRVCLLFVSAREADILDVRMSRKESSHLVAVARP